MSKAVSPSCIAVVDAGRMGCGSDPWLSPMAKPLSDEDIVDLAAFYNNLPIRDEYQ